MKQILALVRANALADTPDSFTLEIDGKKIICRGNFKYIEYNPIPGGPQNGSSELVGRADSLGGDLKCTGSSIPLLFF
jgi:hypothetical protein